MDILESVMLQLNQWMQPFLSEIALSILATILVIYGDVLNKQLKRMVSSYHFILRTIIFVLVCAFGYGLLTVFAAPFVKQLLLMIPYLYRGISIIAVFLLLGYLAEHRRYI
ncbi:DUF3392 domain-containing protein [Paraglaciecola hydrolytica]|uniref:DUF3392 domain-containing protein n=1 Tax=Paraglaciecola hydrolytica TaxID=1799789 RepID=A0A136A1L9_9ALTE|nr:DUF3392 domain-containing protein [Paraglaciecola hydrolytica]KXI29121.1 hypothetical protein AX660_13250 [Paraglaciecola hydrolytica]